MEQSPWQRLCSLDNVSAFSRKASLTVGYRSWVMAGVPAGASPSLGADDSKDALPPPPDPVLVLWGMMSGLSFRCSTSTACTGWERGWGEHNHTQAPVPALGGRDKSKAEAKGK